MPVASPQPTDRIARFGAFELDTRTGELRKRGLRVRLQGQPFEVLAMLVRRAGDLVTREELRERLWAASVFVDFDQGLNKAVLKIRQALGDSAESPRFVETLERRGYRFAASVEWSGATGGGGAARGAPGEAPATVVRVTLGERSLALGDGVHAVGRDPASQVWIDSAVVSKHHARLCVQDGFVTVEDLGSRNGTFLNGVRVAGAAPVADGDEIMIATIRLGVHVATGQTRTLPAHGEPGRP